MTPFERPSPLPLPEHPSTLLELRHASTARPMVVVVPQRRLLAIHGTGTRAGADFALATDVLRIVVGLVRASLSPRPPFGLPSILEVCWSVPLVGTTEEVIEALEEPVRWRQMIELPRSASEVLALGAIDTARRLGGRQVPLVRLVHVTEGPSAQILHLATDPPADAVGRLYDFVFGSGLRPDGDLHELVVADPTVVSRARGRSIYRVPVRLAS